MVIEIQTMPVYGGWTVNGRKHEGTFWGHEYALYLGCRAGFMDIHIDQNSSNDAS